MQGAMQRASYVLNNWVIGDLNGPLYTEVRKTNADHYHPLYDPLRNRRVPMWFVKSRL